MLIGNSASIAAALRQSGPLCDDCLAKATDIVPRQTVNILCRRMEREGVVTRAKRVCPNCGGLKLTNQDFSELTEVVSEPAAETRLSQRGAGLFLLC